jgi:uncharacterized delta-60 repeat protein
MTTRNEPRRDRALNMLVLALAVTPVLLAGACDEDGDDIVDAGDPSTGDGDGDGDGDAGIDAGGDGDGDGDGDIDASVDTDAGADAGEPDANVGPEPIVVGEGTPQIVRLSTTGHDRFYGLTYDADGNIFVTGQVATTADANADFALFVAKFLPSGGLDGSFGMAGVSTLNVTVGGKAAEVARGVVVQSTGKIVIAGTAEHDINAAGLLANDTDLVLVRFNADGSIDEGFGTLGVVRHNLNDAVETTNTQGNPALGGADAQGSLSLAAEDKLVVFGAQRGLGDRTINGTGPRVDSDWAIIRLNADGSFDNTSSQDGKVLLDIGEANASARSATVLADGSIIGAGYTTTNALTDNMGDTTQQPVLFKVTPAGEFDATFATEDQWGATGVWFDYAVAPPLRGEAYGAAMQSDGRFVTMGYGPTSVEGGSGSDIVSFRFSASGEIDRTYGSSNGAAWVDVGKWGDNGRAALVLPDDRVLGIGGGRLPADVNPSQEAALVLLSKDGIPDESFGAGGIRTYDLDGGTADHFWNGAVSPAKDQVAIVGLRGAPAGQNDDGVLLLLPLE